MKTLSSFMVALVLFSMMACNRSNIDLVRISGTIENPTGDSVWVRLWNQFDVNEISESYGALLDSAGRFEITFSLNNPHFAQFFDGNEVSPMYVSPGDDMTMHLDTKYFDETIQYQGIGSYENNYLAQKALKNDYGINIYFLADSLDFNDYSHFLDSTRMEQEAFFKKSIGNLSPEFISAERTNLFYRYPVLLSFAQYKNRKDTLILDQIFKVYKKYLDTKPEDSLSPRYITFLKILPYYHEYAFAERLSNREVYDSVQLQLVVDQCNNFERNIVLGDLFNNMLAYRQNTDYFEKYQTIFDQYVDLPEIRNNILSKYTRLKSKLDKGIPSGAQLTNLNRIEYENYQFSDIIAQYKGRLVYLDFWASWCGPCKSEMPASIQLQRKYQGENISFVYFSTDRDSVAWKKMITILQLTGDHFLLNKGINNEITEKYQLQYIPRYMLINQEGVVIDSDAMRPSNPEVIKNIDNLLKE